jgi:hypothetical protein
VREQRAQDLVRVKLLRWDATVHAAGRPTRASS